MELTAIPGLNLSQLQDRLDHNEILAKHYAHERAELLGLLERLRWERDEVESAITEAEQRLAFVELASEAYGPVPVDLGGGTEDLPF